MATRSFESFIPEVWSARLLAHLEKNHVYGSLMNRDYEGEIKNLGDTVHINQIGNITIQNYDGSDLNDPEEAGGEDLTMVIDQGRAFNVQVKDIDQAQANVNLLDETMRRASYLLNDDVDIYLAGLLAAAGTTDNKNLLAPTDAPTSANAYDLLVDLGTMLSENNVPTLGRWAVIPPWYHALLLKDPRFVGYGTTFNQDVAENGLIGRAAGFELHLSNNVPVASGSYSIVSGTNAAGSFAEQIAEMEAYRREKNFSDAVKVLHVFGAKVVQPGALAVLKVKKS